MPILDEPIVLSIVGDEYTYLTWKDGEGYVPEKGVFGPEYAGEFRLRHQSFRDQTAIQNRLATTFPSGTSSINPRHVDCVFACITIDQVKLEKGVPAWFDPDTKLGTEADEAAVLAILKKYRVAINHRKKASAASSPSS